MRATLSNGDYSWPDVLPFVVYGINSTTHQGLGCSPYEASSGRRPLQWLDAIGRPDTLEVDGSRGDAEALRKGTDRLVQHALEEAQAKMKARADASRRPAQTYKAGERVLVRATVLQSKAESELLGHARKLRSKYVGPFPITERINANAYRVQLPPSSRAHDVINVQHIVKFHPSDSYGRLDAPPPVRWLPAMEIIMF